MIVADSWQSQGNIWEHVKINNCESRNRPGYGVGCNVNGPSVIRVPSWLRSQALKIDDKPAKYYLYFAHHSGDYIRLAYAQHICGPWHVYKPGTLHLDQAKAFTDHIASPDVHIDHKNEQILMYFHGPIQRKPESQKTGVAASKNGIDFIASDEILGGSYFRVQELHKSYYALAFGWYYIDFYKSSNPLSNFEKRWTGENKLVETHEILPGGRHTALYFKDHTGYVFYSKIDEELENYGLDIDSPERIQLGTFKADPKQYLSWRPTNEQEVIKPLFGWEGADLPVKPSQSGKARVPSHELRDPYLFKDGQKFYLFYSGAGEFSIGAAQIKFE
ncbi:MAG: hypothetical protein KDD48_02550 [Bdellovibrionales bacterium]|nr:hypothetical protein [Bdellovibrionales bacterium]